MRFDLLRGAVEVRTGRSRDSLRSTEITGLDFFGVVIVGGDALLIFEHNFVLHLLAVL